MSKRPKNTESQKANDEPAARLDGYDLRNQIEKRAYEIWMSSGYRDGNEVAHWLQAERELLAELQKNEDQKH